MEKDKILVVLLGIFLVITIVQALQLNSLSGKLEGQQAQIAGLEDSSQKLSETNLSIGAGGGGGASLALAKLAELPQMVGGC